MREGHNVKKWKKVSNYANGAIYASGDERKIVLPDCPDIYLELNMKTVRWYPDSGVNNPFKIKKVQRNA
jgi:hypothetical protein